MCLLTGTVGPCLGSGRRSRYEAWSATCDTLHAHTQVLGKLAAALAPPEPQLQHAALRLTARGWETLPLPAPDGSGAIVVALDLHAHEALVEHSDGRTRRVPLAPEPLGRRGHARVCSARSRSLVGPVEIDLDAAGDAVDRSRSTRTTSTRPTTPSRSRRTSPPPRTPRSSSRRSGRRTAGARRRSTPGGGRSTSPSASSPAGRRSRRPHDFIMRNAMDAQEVAVGWWPGDARYPQRRLLRLRASRRRPASPTRRSRPRRRAGTTTLGEYLLDWDDVRTADDPHATALAFARSAVRHACTVCEWDPALAASVDGNPPPVA